MLAIHESKYPYVFARNNVRYNDNELTTNTTKARVDDLQVGQRYVLVHTQATSLIHFYGCLFTSGATAHHSSRFIELPNFAYSFVLNSSMDFNFSASSASYFATYNGKSTALQHRGRRTLALPDSIRPSSCSSVLSAAVWINVSMLPCLTNSSPIANLQQSHRGGRGW